MASNEVEYSQPKQKQSRLDRFLGFLWDGENKQFLGRTASSWGQVGLFYLIYYSCLAGFFAISLAVFFTTIDRNYPKQQLMQTPIKNNPGMGFRPMPDIDSTLIRFEQGKPESYKVYTDHIQSFLEQYENEAQDGENFIDCQHLAEEDRDKDKVCRFNIDMLGNECTWQKDYGYDEGQPCVLLKLNKIYGWEPEPLDNESIPWQMGDRYNSEYVGISCEGENPADQENMGPVTFYPKSGMPMYYYPYLNQEGYRQPLVMAKFNRPKNGIVSQIWCKAWVKDIKHHKNDKAGSIHFELMVD